jgi:hypothetical protein
MEKLVGWREGDRREPVHERFSLRAALIRLLVGKRPVCMNCTIHGELHVEGEGGVIAGNMTLPAQVVS